MTKTTKSLLAISLVCFVVGLAFVTGLVNVRRVAALYVVLPLGAVFFGLFLLSKILEQEFAAYDLEQRNAHSRETLSGTHQPERVRQSPVDPSAKSS